MDIPCRKGSATAKKGIMIITTRIAPNPPTETMRIASLDLPSKTILWPGRMDVAVPSSGTPRSIDGTNSIRACAIDIETNITHKNSADM